MGTLRVLSSRGDDQVMWDVDRIAVGDPDAADAVSGAVSEAERIFREQRARGATAVRIEQDRAPVRIEQFDPSAKQILVIPRVVGG